MESKTESRLIVKNISKTFYAKKADPNIVVDDVSFDVKSNEFWSY